MIPPYYSLSLNVEAKKCCRACRNVSIIGLSGYNSCRRKARKRNEYACYVAERQFVRVLKLVDDTLRSRLNRRQIVRHQIRRSAVKPSSKVLFHIYTRNETFDSFDNFPEEICRASRAFCYDPAHTYVTALATLFKMTSLSSSPEELVLLFSGILETQIMLERIPPALKSDEFDRPLSWGFNGHAYVPPLSRISVFAWTIAAFVISRVARFIKKNICCDRDEMFDNFTSETQVASMEAC